VIFILFFSFLFFSPPPSEYSELPEKTSCHFPAASGIQRKLFA